MFCISAETNAQESMTAADGVTGERTVAVTASRCNVGTGGGSWTPAGWMDGTPSGNSYADATVGGLKSKSAGAFPNRGRDYRES